LSNFCKQISLGRQGLATSPAQRKGLNQLSPPSLGEEWNLQLPRAKGPLLHRETWFPRQMGLSFMKKHGSS